MKKHALFSLLLSTFLLTGCVDRNPDQERIDELSKIFGRHYAERVVTFENENKTASNVDIVFLGDSLTEKYNVKNYYHEYNVLNRGISGDTTIGVETRLGVSAYEVDPKVLVMLIGVNNIDTMLDNFESILNGFKTNIPETKVVLLSLTCMTKNYAYRNNRVIENNLEIKHLADKYEYTYVDIYTSLLDTNTNELNMNYTVDGLHFNSKGYEIITSTVKPVIQNCLK